VALAVLAALSVSVLGTSTSIRTIDPYIDPWTELIIPGLFSSYDRGHALGAPRVTTTRTERRGLIGTGSGLNTSMRID